MTRQALDSDAFRSRYGPWALVAGASDGIGEAFARELAGRGLNLILLARRQALLEKVASELRDANGIETRVLVSDLTSADLDREVAKACHDVEVGLLVYNAGAVHGANKFHDQSIDHALGLIDLNCRGPALLAHRFGNAMRGRGRGGMLFLTSMASLAGSSYTATYNATKSFDMILAESLWHELSPEGIDVMAVVAGATRTPSMLESNPEFADYPGIMEPMQVAGGALRNLGRGPVWVAGDTNRASAHGLSPIPRIAAINGMSRACAEIYALPFTEVEGTEFADLD